MLIEINQNRINLTYHINVKNVCPLKQNKRMCLYKSLTYTGYHESLRTSLLVIFSKFVPHRQESKRC